MEPIKSNCCFLYILAILVLLLNPNVLVRSHPYAYDVDINESEICSTLHNISYAHCDVCKFNTENTRKVYRQYFSLTDDPALDSLLEDRSRTASLLLSYDDSRRSDIRDIYFGLYRWDIDDDDDDDVPVWLRTRYRQNLGHYAALRGAGYTSKSYHFDREVEYNRYWNPAYHHVLSLRQVKYLLTDNLYHLSVEVPGRLTVHQAESDEFNINNTDNTASKFQRDLVDHLPESAFKAHFGLHQNTSISTKWITSCKPKLLNFTYTRIKMKKICDSADYYEMDESAWISFFHLLTKFIGHPGSLFNMSARFVRHDECWGFASSLSKIIFLINMHAHTYLRS